MSEVNAPVRRKPGPKPGTKVAAKPIQAPSIAPKGYIAGNHLNTADLPLGQAPDIVLPATGAVPRGESIEVLDKPLDDDYTAMLAMAEDAITIIIEPGTEENAPKVVDCWVNGKGAEVQDQLTGKWMEINCLPIGNPIVTKRKYVEVLARSKITNVKTQHEGATVDNPENRVVRNTSRKAVFSVIEDRNPRGREWLTRLIAGR